MELDSKRILSLCLTSMNSVGPLEPLLDLSGSWESLDLAQLSLSSHVEGFVDDSHDYGAVEERIHWLWALLARLFPVEDPAFLGTLSHPRLEARSEYFSNDGLHTVVSIPNQLC